MGSHVVLGEGDRDKAFLEHLCENRGIVGLTYDYAGGIGGFGSRLLAMSTDQSFQTCKAILLMGDTDELDDKSFDLIRDQLKDIDFPVPSRPLEITRKQNKPALAVLMQPYPAQGPDASGCMESLLIPAIESLYVKEAACVDEMIKCAGIATWKRRDARDKARVRFLLSSAYREDPMHGLGYCFCKDKDGKDKNLIPLGHAAFNETALVLQHFAAWTASTEKYWDAWRKTQGI
jgi:hypothetical protein